jgi:hypothetical protein
MYTRLTAVYYDYRRRPQCPVPNEHEYANLDRVQYDHIGNSEGSLIAM